MRFVGLRLSALRFSDVVLPGALVLWWFGVQATDPTEMNDYGLFAAFPVVFFVAIGLLIGSIVATVGRPQLSPVRLGLHLIALVMMLHATMPLIFAEPIYPWAYKHVGVVGYINLHGSVDSRIDIYHNWPGFFALAAWFTRMSGATSPLDYAAWAPLYFNLVACLELAFVYRLFPVTQRARWVGLFLFVAGNWVGQDYFAPQAVAFVLSLAVFGMVLAWLRANRPPAVVRAAHRMVARVARHEHESGRDEGVPPGLRPPRAASLIALFLVFAALVITHQLSPYMVLLGLGLLTVAGMVRPRWVMVCLAAIAIGYLLVHLTYIERTQDLFGALNPFGNIVGAESDDSVVMTGRRVTALAAPALVLSLWTLGLVGVVRRVVDGRPTLVLSLLALSPTLMALAQSYGGEAVFRIYLFSLPWIALLGASALEFRSARRRLWPAVATGVVMSGAVAMYMSATFGAAELYAVWPGELTASEYFYANAEPGSALSLAAPNFPTRVGNNYNEFTATGDNPPDLISAVPDLRHRMLGSADLPAVAAFVAPSEATRLGGYFLVLSTGQRIYAEVLGLLPRGSLSSLDAALTQSPDWQVFLRNRDAVIYQYAPDRADEPFEPFAPVISRGQPEYSIDRTVDPVGLGAGLAGLVLVGLIVGSRMKTAG